MANSITNKLKVNDVKSVLIEANNMALTDLYNVISSLSEADLSYRFNKLRNIKEILTHIKCSQNCLYINKYVLQNENVCDCKDLNKINDILIMIENLKLFFIEAINKISEKDLNEKVTTEWGQTLTKRQLFIQITAHTYYHISEICFISGLGGFYKNVLG